MKWRSETSASGWQVLWIYRDKNKIRQFMIVKRSVRILMDVIYFWMTFTASNCYLVVM